ncbi:MAG: folate-binding protein [Methylococcales bacterium]
MNLTWVTFLKSNNRFFPENSTKPLTDSLENNDHLIAALPHLATLQVTGLDANTFLQGQLSCDINELTESKSFFAAFCNAKGRTISTLLIIKRTHDFILLLPVELLEKVSKKLQMYIMRSDVQLNNMQDELCLIGINSTNTFPEFPQENFAVSHKNGAILIKLPLRDNRHLIISPASEAISLWKGLTSNSALVPCHSSLWVEQDISAGIPWLNQENSEEYIPQMLNIDKLGGISYTKGCYTGQEIIARTHYLGKAKRELFLAYCKKAAIISIGTQIITDTNEQIVGKVLSLQSNNYHTKMLVVMHSADTELKNLILNNSNQDKINIIDFQ